MQAMRSVAVIGANGYVGSALLARLLPRREYAVEAVTRENYLVAKEKEYDVVINCAMPSGKFWAQNNPQMDFKETVEKTADILYGWKFKKFVQVSTISARCQLDTVYGRHKAAAEKLCDFGDNLVVRLGAIYSEEIKKGVLSDMLHGKKVYADGSSRYPFISLAYCADWIASNLDRKGIVELGGRNAIALKAITEHLQANVEFEGAVAHLDVESEEKLPEASEVLAFLDSLKK